MKIFSVVLSVCLWSVAALAAPAAGRGAGVPALDRAAAPVHVGGFLYELPSGSGGEIAPAVRATYRDAKGAVVAEQTFSIRRGADGMAPVVTLLANAGEEVRAIRTVVISIDGAALEELSIEALRKRDAALRGSEVLAREIDDVVNRRGAKAQRRLLVASNANFECPNATPYCDDQLDLCRDTCGYADPYNDCNTCYDRYHKCNGGEVVNTWTEETEFFYSGSGYKCKDGKLYVHRIRETTTKSYTTYYCKPTDEYITVMTSSNTVREDCYQLLDPTYCPEHMWPPVPAGAECFLPMP